jgi:hypothetical protein
MKDNEFPWHIKILTVLCGVVAVGGFFFGIPFIMLMTSGCGNNEPVIWPIDRPAVFSPWLPKESFTAVADIVDDPEWGIRTIIVRRESDEGRFRVFVTPGEKIVSGDSVLVYRGIIVQSHWWQADILFGRKE